MYEQCESIKQASDVWSGLQRVGFAAASRMLAVLGVASRSLCLSFYSRALYWLQLLLSICPSAHRKHLSVRRVHLMLMMFSSLTETEMANKG